METNSRLTHVSGQTAGQLTRGRRGGRVLGGGGRGRMIKSIGSIIFNLSEFTQRSFEPELGAKLQ